MTRRVRGHGDVFAGIFFKSWVLLTLVPLRRTFVVLPHDFGRDSRAPILWPFTERTHARRSCRPFPSACAELTSCLAMSVSCYRIAVLTGQVISVDPYFEYLNRKMEERDPQALLHTVYMRPCGAAQLHYILMQVRWRRRLARIKRRMPIWRGACLTLVFRHVFRRRCRFGICHALRPVLDFRIFGDVSSCACHFF